MVVGIHWMNFARPLLLKGHASTMPHENDNTNCITDHTPRGAHVPSFAGRVMLASESLKSQLNQLHDMIEFMDERDKRECFDLICEVIEHLEPFEEVITSNTVRETTAGYFWHQFRADIRFGTKIVHILEGDVWHRVEDVERQKHGDDENYTVRYVITTTEDLTFTLTRDETVTVRI
jgi:hypothetical protein